MKVWLASGSDRRRLWLMDRWRGHGILLAAEAMEGVDEAAPVGLTVEDQVRVIAQRKADAAIRALNVEDASWTFHALDEERSIVSKPDLVLVSDTLVEDPEDTKVAMGKPGDALQARKSLMRLSGRYHRVWSATGRIVGGHAVLDVECATVEIGPLSDVRLDALIHSGSWVGKAGGYDLAGAMGAYARLVDGHRVCVLGFAGSSVVEPPSSSSR